MAKSQRDLNDVIVNGGEAAVSDLTSEGTIYAVDRSANGVGNFIVLVRCFAAGCWL